MELVKVQFRKSRLDIQREKEAAAAMTAAKAKAEQKQQKQHIRPCKFCGLDIEFKKAKDGKVVMVDARHFFVPLYEGEEWVRHQCSY